MFLPKWKQNNQNQTQTQLLGARNNTFHTLAGQISSLLKNVLAGVSKHCNSDIRFTFFGINQFYKLSTGKTSIFEQSITANSPSQARKVLAFPM